jgi:hypothetical protein
MARRTNQLNVDRLETRDLMAGNLSAVVSNGILFVKEGFGSTNTNNGLQIFQLSNGRYRVVGLSAADGTPTRVNGADSAEFVVPTGKLNVKLGAGNDTVFLHGARPDVVTINVGAPNIADTDLVVVDGVQTRGLVHIVTGGGNDTVAVRNSKIGNGIGTTSDDLSIFTGAGADTVEVGSNDGFVEVAGRMRVATFSSATAVEDDRVTIKSTIVSKLMALDLGAGKDRLTIENSFGDDIVALTGTGDDTVKLTEVRAFDQFFVDTSHGNDTLDMVFLSATDLAIHGGTGFDKLTRFLDGPTHTRTITGWESINGVVQPLTGGLGVPVGGGTASR